MVAINIINVYKPVAQDFQVDYRSLEEGSADISAFSEPRQHGLCHQWRGKTWQYHAPGQG